MKHRVDLYFDSALRALPPDEIILQTIAHYRKILNRAPLGLINADIQLGMVIENGLKELLDQASPYLCITPRIIESYLEEINKQTLKKTLFFIKNKHML